MFLVKCYQRIQWKNKWDHFYLPVIGIKKQTGQNMNYYLSHGNPLIIHWM